MIIAGIDPGLKGGIVVLVPEETPLRFEMPTIEIKSKGTKAKIRHEYDEVAIRKILLGQELEALVDRYLGAPVEHVFIEKQQPMTKPMIKRCPKCGTIVETTQAQGIISTFQTGVGFGILKGICAGIPIPYSTIAPQSWQPKMLGGVQGADSKARARVVAGQLFPHLDLRANDRCRVPHEGIVDALLIAIHGQRSLGLSSYEEDPDIGF